MPFQTSFSKGTDRDTQCASHWINIALTFKGPVVWLVDSFWQTQNNQTPQQCVNSKPSSNEQSVHFSLVGFIIDSSTPNTHTTQGAYTVHATYRYEPASDSREDALIVVLTVKIRRPSTRRAVLHHCSKVSGYVRACVCLCVNTSHQQSWLTWHKMRGI